LNDEIEKKINCKKEPEKKDQSQLGLTFQTRDPSHEVKIISKKTNLKNHEA
jgi:hypothetical protein